MVNYAEKEFERARETKEYFAKVYNVPQTHIVWAGGEKYIIVKDRREIKIGFER